MVTKPIGGAAGGEGTGMEKLMNKPLELISSDSTSVRMWSLDAIGHVAEPVARSVIFVELFASLKDEEKRRLIRKINSIL